MKKPTKLLSIIALILLLIISGYLYFYYFIKIPKAIATDSWVFKFPDKYEEYEIVKCNLFDIKSPEYAFVGILTVYDTRSYEVDFYKPENNNPFSNIVVNYTGGTTVENTTFPELVEMVKEDCSQFQDGHASEVEGGPEWIYTRAQTTEEKAHDIRRGFLDDENRFPLFKEIYGDVKEMTDEEVLALSKRIDEEGLDERVEVRIKATAISNKIYKFTDEQTDKLRKHYGEWKDFTDEELIEWEKQIAADYDEGKFDL